MNIVCLPGNPCDQVLWAIKRSNGGIRPLFDKKGGKYLGLCIVCPDGEAIFFNNCPFCGAELYVPKPTPEICQTGLTKTGGIN